MRLDLFGGELVFGRFNLTNPTRGGGGPFALRVEQRAQGHAHRERHEARPDRRPCLPARKIVVNRRLGRAQRGGEVGDLQPVLGQPGANLSRVAFGQVDTFGHF